MRTIALAVWAVSACLVFWHLWWESRRPATATDVRCDHIDQELDAAAEARRRHPAGRGLTSTCVACGAPMDVALLGAHARLQHPHERPVGPEDSPVVMAEIARRARHMGRAS